MVSVRAPQHWTFGTTADMGIGAEAPTVDDLYAEMGRALFSVMTDLSTIRPRVERSFDVEAPDPAGLLVAFLSELLFLRDSEDVVLGEFSTHVTGEHPFRLHAAVRGEPWDLAQHPRHIEVKAITLHQVEVDLRTPRARVILDI